MQTPRVESTTQVQPPVQTDNVSQAAVVPGNDASTIASANPAQEKGFVTAIYDTVVGAITWVKEKIVACFSYIRSLFCGFTDQVKTTQLTTLNRLKALVEKTRVDFLKERDADSSADKVALRKFWTAAFNALPQDIQNALIKEDLRDIYQGKPDSEKVVEDKFNNQETKAERIAFIRDLTPSRYTDVGRALYYADADQYIPSYLQHIASQIGNDIKALSEE
ncbi:MAG: hypothetical protein JSS30_02220 [Verrucomicrobia bacterium]|nr:hypothetical protein [Verrucomicrobiota bacterium]